VENQVAKKDPSKFDWVTERSSCSLPKIFLTLRQQVEADVKARNGLRPANSPYEFSVANKSGDFMAVLTAKESSRSVTFNLAEKAIVVLNNEGEKMFEISLAFTEKGECKLIVNKEERESWQVRRMALEDLMFRGQ
jgi:hypothetical protein